MSQSGVKHVLVTGGQGQVGLELAALDWPADIAVHFPKRADLDMTSSDSIRAFMSGRDWHGIINCAAWTAVDDAETQVVDAWAVNAMGPACLAEASHALGIPLVHVSTDYVFSGDLNRSYSESDPTGPRSVYGASKLGGEWAILTANPRSVILRTAWVQSRHRNNFVKTMLRLAKTRDSLGVVDDQRGNPTAAGDIADALQCIMLRMLAGESAPTGIHHFVNAGEATWADLAEFVFARARETGSPGADVLRITSDQYPTKASRPANSRLSTSRIAENFGIRPRDWRSAIGEVVDQIYSEEPLA